MVILGIMMIAGVMGMYYLLEGHTLTPGLSSEISELLGLQPDIDEFEAIGDSVGAGHPGYYTAYENGGTATGDEESQIWYWLAEKLGSSFTNYGDGGETSAQISARFDTCISNGSTVFIQGGLNDNGNGISPAQTLYYFKQMYSTAQNKSCTVYIMSLTPSNLSARAEPYQSTNTLLNNWCNDNDITFLNCYDKMLKTGSSYQPNPDYYLDHIHPTVGGYKVLGYHINDLLRGIG